MPYKKVAGLPGRVFVPATCRKRPAKHRCADCYDCQFCSDNRCSQCLRKKRERKS